MFSMSGYMNFRFTAPVFYSLRCSAALVACLCVNVMCLIIRLSHDVESASVPVFRFCVALEVIVSTPGFVFQRS